MPTVTNRTAYSNLIDNGDGTSTLQLGGNPNVRDWVDGQYKPLDQTIIIDSVTHFYKVNYTNTKVRFADKTDKLIFEKYIENEHGEWIKWTVDKTFISCVLEDGNEKIRWTTADGTEISCRSDEKCVKPDIKQKDGTTIKFTIENIPGLVVSYTNGEVVYKNGNDIVYKIPKPFYTDSDGEKIYFDFTWIEVIANEKYELTLPDPPVEVIIGGFAEVDPTTTFGERSGADVTGTHKDGILEEQSFSADNSAGAVSVQATRQRSPDRSNFNVCRFDISSLQSNISIDSADLKYVVALNTVVINNNIEVMFRNLHKSYGKGDTIEDTNSAPATDGSATFNARSRVDGGAGDTPWDGGANFEFGIDSSATLVRRLFSSGDVVDSTHTLDFTKFVRDWFYVGNFGYSWVGKFAFAESSSSFQFHAQESVSASKRPQLEITFTVLTGKDVTVKSFGKRTGTDFSTNHKDNEIRESSKTASQGLSTSVEVRAGTVSERVVIGRWDISAPRIPVDATIICALMKVDMSLNELVFTAPFPFKEDVNFRKMLTENGIGPLVEDSSSTPATDGSATFDAAKRVDGGAGDTKWGGGGDFSRGTDCGPILDTVRMYKNESYFDFDLVPSELIFDVTDAMTDWHAGVNEGWAILGSTGDSGDVKIYTQDEVTFPERRPILYVAYSEDSATALITIDTVGQRTDGSKLVDINYTGTDELDLENDLVQFEYTVDDDYLYGAWNTMTAKVTDLNHDGVSNLSFTSGGASFTFVWDVLSDIGPGIEDAIVFVRLKLTIYFDRCEIIIFIFVD